MPPPSPVIKGIDTQRDIIIKSKATTNNAMAVNNNGGISNMPPANITSAIYSAIAKIIVNIVATQNHGFVLKDKIDNIMVIIEKIIIRFLQRILEHQLNVLKH